MSIPFALALRIAHVLRYFKTDPLKLDKGQEPGILERGRAMTKAGEI